MVYDWFQHIIFANPACFGLLVLVPGMIYWYVRKTRPGHGAILVSSTRNFYGVRSWKNTFRHSSFVLRVLAVICIIIALARPQIRNEEQMVNGEGIDIVLCLDISGSMLAQDFSPNRMEAAKSVAADFIDSRPADRIGLVIFSGESLPCVPSLLTGAFLNPSYTTCTAGCWKMVPLSDPVWLPA